MKITILTMCPELFDSFLDSHVVKRAQKLGAGHIRILDIRPFAGGSYRHIDDSPFGGGKGLVLRCGPVLEALAEAEKEGAAEGCGPAFKIALVPAGLPYDQKRARELAGKDHLILICGRYEGMDARIYDHVDLRLSVGDYVLTGGEIPAMAVADSVLRLLKGNLKEGSAEEESFENGLLEYPQYTQPADYQGEKVPEVLLSGNHAKIRAWRLRESLRETLRFRPDLLEGRKLTPEESKYLAEISAERKGEQ
ncbi:MAG: tRNA (guanosine(37)-N1)-methyltransferase TrmD [bacterium]